MATIGPPSAVVTSEVRVLCVCSALPLMGSPPSKSYGLICNMCDVILSWFFKGA